MSVKDLLVRPAIQAMDGYVPGEQPQERRYIKLNTNENPYPPSPRVLEALRAAIGEDLRLYPDPSAHSLRRKAAEVYGLSPAQVLAGNGSDDLLAILFRACVEGGSSGQVAYPIPTYSLYDTLARIQGAVPDTVPFPADFVLPAEALVACRARLTLICNPNSPSGTFTPLSTIEKLAKQTAGLVVVDEAYVDFARESALPLLGSFPNLVILRTFSKSFSLAGMRIGLAFGSPDVIAELDKVRDSYNLDRLSMVAGRAALDDYAWMQANVAKVRTARDELVAELHALGFRVPASEANFVFATSPKQNGAGLYRELKERGILVRYFPTPALREGVRSSVGTPEQNHALVSALHSLHT